MNDWLEKDDLTEYTKATMYAQLLQRVKQIKNQVFKPEPSPVQMITQTERTMTSESDSAAPSQQLNATDTQIIDSPPTTPHGSIENAFPVWRQNFHHSFKFDTEVDHLCSHFFCTNLGYTTVIVDKIFVARLEGESGKGIHRNVQANGKWLCFSAFNSSTARWTGLTWCRIPYLTGGTYEAISFLFQVKFVSCCYTRLTCG